MKQYGDITKLNGEELSPVDLIVGGSPCQDLSVAGKRAGLEGERSGLFMEMIRIVKEMRNATNFIRPRWLLWENVCGAFSSGQPKGADFQAVLAEIVRIVEPEAPVVPIPAKGWSKSGMLMGDGWSLAWRTHDAQYWGVPQRRRRISLVADFRGQSAPEILFERTSLSGDPDQSAAEREGSARTAEDGIGKASKCLNPWDVQSKHIQPEDGIAEALYSGGCRYGGGESYVLNDQGGAQMSVTEGVTNTLRSQMKHHEPMYGTGGNNQPLVVATMQGIGDYAETGVASALKQRDFKDATDLVYGLDRASFNQGKNAKYDFQIEKNKASPLVSRGPSAVATTDDRNDTAHNYVRRLTPLECERLQGFPDGWTAIPGASDSARYKALGNSIARPFWTWLAKRLVSMGEVKTIGSLFDGIGGFPLCFGEAGAETLWTSEIEPFCQKVVEYHFGKENEDDDRR